MDFKQIEAFVNVVKYKSFSKAADASFLTQPTISTHISTLEKELGVRLIDRQGKEALPTRQGKLLYKHAVHLLNTREKAIFSIMKYGSEIDGVLEIQASSVPGEYLVPALMAKFKESHPKVKFYLEQSDSETVEEHLQNHKGELGFVGSSHSSNLQYQTLVKDRMVLITPVNPKFKNKAGKALRVAEFIEEPFVWREQGSATRKEFEDQILGLGYDPRQMHVVARFNSGEAIKQAVSHGLGVSIISHLAVDQDVNQRNYSVFEIEDLNLEREFSLAWNKNTALSPTAEAFKEFVMKTYRINV